jgi:hypothetical protein
LHRDDDFALCATGLDIGQCIPGLLKRFEFFLADASYCWWPSRRNDLKGGARVALAGVAAQVLAMRNLDSERIEFNFLGLLFAYLFILIIGPIIVFFSENSCEVIEGFQKGVFYTDASRIWGAIILELIVGSILMAAFYDDVKNTDIVNGRLVVLDYIEVKSNLSSLLFQYLRAKPRFYYAYPIILFVVSYLGAGIFRCVGS